MINPPTCCPKMHQKKYKEKYKRWDKCLWNEDTCMEESIFGPKISKDESSVPILGWRRNHWRRLCQKVVFHQLDRWVHQERVNWRSGMAVATVQCHGHKDPQPSCTGVIVYMGLIMRKWYYIFNEDMLRWFTKIIYNDALWWWFIKMIYNDDLLLDVIICICYGRCNRTYRYYYG